MNPFHPVLSNPIQIFFNLSVCVYHFCIAVSPQWDAMKLSLMIEEANKISAKLRKNTVFSRYGKTSSGHSLHDLFH